MMTQATTPPSKHARSRRRLQSLKELQKRPNLSPEGKKKLPGLIEMQERVVRIRERAYLKNFKLGKDGDITQH